MFRNPRRDLNLIKGKRAELETRQLPLAEKREFAISRRQSEFLKVPQKYHSTL